MRIGGFVDAEKIIENCTYRYSRSGGKGGQHVNKVSTRVEIMLDIAATEGLSEEEKNRLFINGKRKISQEGVLLITCEETRSQVKNKEIAEKKLLEYIREKITVQKKRKPTRPSKASKVKRSEDKKKRSEIKSGRKNPLL